MTIAIEKESFNLELYAEILPLAQKCWEESTMFKGETCAYFGERDFMVEPDLAVYEKFANHGSVVVVTLRENTILKGYVVGFTHYSLHHKKILCGHGDSIYIEPEHRSYTCIVIDKFERAMKELNVQMIGWPAHVDGPVYQVLKNRGFVNDDVIMEKRI